MKTLAEKIEVMQAFELGERVEYSCSGHDWSPIEKPEFNWADLDYRIAPKPAEPVYVQWTLATIPRPLPNVVNKLNGVVHAISSAHEFGIYLGNATGYIKWSELKDSFDTLDGKPCGTLEVKR